MRMRVVNLLCSLFFFIPSKAFSQSQSTSHAFQLQFEALGPGVSSSFNIDSRLTKKENGIGYCNITKCCTSVCPEDIKITDNAIIPLKERVVDRFYDPLKKFFRIFRSKKQEE